MSTTLWGSTEMAKTEELKSEVRRAENGGVLEEGISIPRQLEGSGVL